MGNYIKKPTQEQRVLDMLIDAEGQWVDGMAFLQLFKPITQYHARIWGLQKRGYKIKGEFIPGKNWKQYKLESNPEPLKLFNYGQLQQKILSKP